MADPYLRQDALAHRGLAARSTHTAGDAGVRLWQEGARTQLALRGDVEDAAFVRAVRRITGTALPEPSRASVGKGVSLLWMGPDEWLVVAEEDLQLHERLESALGVTIVQGYGLTAVVHHPGRVFSLYAGLGELQVAAEDVLSLGQVIGIATDTLYFEIREENRPVDPARWLR